MVQTRIGQPKDAKAIARGIILAMDELALKFTNSDNSERANEVFQFFASQKNNQYSFENTIVCEENEEVLGVILAYDGGSLAELRKPFLDYIRMNYDFEGTPEDETEAGEIYLDTVSVFPEYQGKGIGQKLIQALIEQSRERGFSKVGLLVDSNNPSAKRLYERIGFQGAGPKSLLGGTYAHMVYEL